MKKAAVTGATGFLGAHLACLLKSEGFEVTCLHRQQNFSLFDRIARPYGYAASEFIWITADILDTDSLLHAFTNCDVVFHCAAKVSFRTADIQSIYETNVEGTRNVCNTCIKLNHIPLVYASSVAALGRKAGQKEITENTEWVESPYNSEYANSKYLAELEIRRASAEGLKITMVNPGVILGPGDGESGSGAVFKHVMSGSKFYPIGSTGFVGVKDVCRAMLEMYRQDITDTRMILVAETLSYREMLAMVAEILQVKSPSVPLKGALQKLALGLARFCEWLHIPFPFPSQGLRSTAFRSHYRSENIALLQNFEFTPIRSVLEEACSDLKA